jgi:hypothetical protein
MSFRRAFFMLVRAASSKGAKIHQVSSKDLDVVFNSLNGRNGVSAWIKQS